MIEEMKNVAEESAKQTEATIVLSMEARRDSEIMKTITVATMVYLPATFVCVSRTSCLFSSPCMLNVTHHIVDCI